ETQSNYTLIGLFVVALASAVVILSLWLVGETGRGETETYLVYVEESVSGLEPNSRVRMQGVPVGHVQSIALDPRDPERVRVRLELAAGTPVRTDTVATLRNEGLTGLLRLELTGGSPDAEPLSQREDEPFPVISYRPSLLANLEDGAEAGVDAIEVLSHQIQRSLTDENVDALTDSLHDLRGFAASLARNSGQLDRIMRSTAAIGEAGEDLVRRLPTTLDRLDRTLVRFEGLAEDLRVTNAEVTRTVSASRAGVETLNRQTIPEIDLLLGDIRRLSGSLQHLSDDLGEEPAMLLFGRPDPQPGPGE
ncbi:MAG: MCE family protein, partial [Thioalkalivibrio sp.]|nr:MCE family protein [Thioalkalivibrio sp.]